MNVKEINVENIELPKNIPVLQDELQYIIQTVKTLGLVEPIVVKRIFARDRYKLISGYKRLLAYRKLAKISPIYSKIPAVIVDVPETDIELLRLISLVATPKGKYLEISRLVAKLKHQFGNKLENIAEKTGISLSKLKLFALYRKALKTLSGILTAETYTSLLKLPPTSVLYIASLKQNLLTEAVAKFAVSHNPPPSFIKYIVTALNTGIVPKNITIALKDFENITMMPDLPTHPSSDTKEKAKKKKARYINQIKNLKEGFDQLRNMVDNAKDWVLSLKTAEPFQVDIIFTQIYSKLAEIEGIIGRLLKS